MHATVLDTDPAARVVYVDNNPVVLRHSEALVGHERAVLVVAADARRPAEILDDPGVGAFIDFRRPVGLLMFAILHHFSDDDDPAGITARFRAALAPGSYLAISSFRMPAQDHPQERVTASAIQQLFNQTLGTGVWREEKEILDWFGDWTLIAPGLVPLPEWRPDTATPLVRDSTYHWLAGGVAAKG